MERHKGNIFWYHDGDNKKLVNVGKKGEWYKADEVDSERAKNQAEIARLRKALEEIKKKVKHLAEGYSTPEKEIYSIAIEALRK